jgi:hypothetical protein
MPATPPVIDGILVGVGIEQVPLACLTPYAHLSVRLSRQRDLNRVDWQRFEWLTQFLVRGIEDFSSDYTHYFSYRALRV